MLGIGGFQRPSGRPRPAGSRHWAGALMLMLLAAAAGLFGVLTVRSLSGVGPASDDDPARARAVAALLASTRQSAALCASAPAKPKLQVQTDLRQVPGG